MKCLENEKLSKYTTVKIGGITKKMLIPENTEELIDVIKQYNPSYFIGGGSNLLISDRSFDLVVNLRHFNDKIEDRGNGVYYIGASVRLQKLIHTINENGYGGIEYLFSVPGLVGGAVVMNAGRGKAYKMSISDYIISVDTIDNGERHTFTKDQCKFEYRSSIFKNSDSIILGILFKFPEQDKEISEKLRKERIDLCKSLQDNTKPNFGSVFMEANDRIINFVKRQGIGNKNIHFSKKTRNWLLNENNGTYVEAMKAIKKVEFMHKLFRKKCVLEVIVWK